MTEEEFQPEGPQPLVRSVPAGKPYPVHALGPLKQAVEFVQGRTLAPVELAAQSALAVASLAVMGHADVETLVDRSPTGLYLLTIANSGERKSTCDAFFMKAIHEFEADEGRKVAKAMAQWADDDAIWKARRSDLMKRIRDDDEQAKEELQKLGPEPVPPASGDLVVTEPTYEGLTRAFKEGRPALGIFADEGGQFLGGYAMNKENRLKTLAAFNDLWGGKPIKRTRQGDGGYTLTGRRLAIHLMVQPTVAAAFMADPQTVDTGFLPRFLITEPPSTIGTRLREKVRNGDFFGMAGFSQRLTDILQAPLPMDQRTRALTPRLLKMTVEARAILSGFADDVEIKQGRGQPYSSITGFASKAAEMAARIAGVLTLWADLRAKVVSGDTMRDAVTLAAYYLDEAARLMQGAVADVQIDRAEKLRLWLTGSWNEDEITASEVVQFGPNALRDSKVVNKALNVLADHGWLVPMTKGSVIRGHARTKAWRIVR